MALNSQSLLLYGFNITPNNQYISFKASSGGPTLLATIALGFYTLDSLGAAIVSALGTADTANTYSYAANRSVAGGTQNRVMLSTSGTYLSLLFNSGNPSNPASLIGFNATDYTGSTSYTGSSSAGTAVIPQYIGYNFSDQNMMRKNFGAVNLSASGVKESIVFALQQFMQVKFMHEPYANLSAVWQPLIDWLIQQRPFEFTPNISSPTVYQEVTLEDPNGGLEFEMTEELPDMPNYYSTPLMKFRIVPSD